MLNLKLFFLCVNPVVVRCMERNLLWIIICKLRMQFPVCSFAMCHKKLRQKKSKIHPKIRFALAKVRVNEISSFAIRNVAAIFGQFSNDVMQFHRHLSEISFGRRRCEMSAKILESKARRSFELFYTVFSSNQLPF